MGLKLSRNSRKPENGHLRDYTMGSPNTVRTYMLWRHKRSRRDENIDITLWNKTHIRFSPVTSRCACKITAHIYTLLISPSTYRTRGNRPQPPYHKIHDGSKSRRGCFFLPSFLFSTTFQPKTVFHILSGPFRKRHSVYFDSGECGNNQLRPLGLCCKSPPLARWGRETTQFGDRFDLSNQPWITSPAISHGNTLRSSMTKKGVLYLSESPVPIHTDGNMRLYIPYTPFSFIPASTHTVECVDECCLLLFLVILCIASDDTTMNEKYEMKKKQKIYKNLNKRLTCQLVIWAPIHETFHGLKSNNPSARQLQDEYFLIPKVRWTWIPRQFYSTNVYNVIKLWRPAAADSFASPLAGGQSAGVICEPIQLFFFFFVFVFRNVVPGINGANGAGKEPRGRQECARDQAFAGGIPRIFWTRHVVRFLYAFVPVSFNWTNLRAFSETGEGSRILQANLLFS